MDLHIDATTNESPASEEEEMKDGKKKDIHQLPESEFVGACQEAAEGNETPAGQTNDSEKTYHRDKVQIIDQEKPDNEDGEKQELPSSIQPVPDKPKQELVSEPKPEPPVPVSTPEEDGEKQELRSSIQPVPPVPDKPKQELVPEPKPEPPVPESTPEGHSSVKMAVLMAVLAVIIGFVFFGRSSPQPDPKMDTNIDIFRREFEKIKSSFPSQRTELWHRSKIHLERHLQTAKPREPVSMILTSGRRAEGTLRCLASRMAATFASTLGASVLHIDGASMAATESGQVKLDIDEQLSGAFEGDKRAAVIHRFEELPPGSSLIFYRYCDHENAAYKRVLLVFTVQLPADDLGPELSLNEVEEMVQEHIEGKFLSRSSSASYDQMDRDKLSGLWSRISHLILPVTAEETVEQQGCDHLKSLQL